MGVGGFYLVGMRTPPTLLSLMTPPMAVTRSLSLGLLVLWSWVSCRARLWMLATALPSPRLATIISPCLMRTQVAAMISVLLEYVPRRTNIHIALGILTIRNVRTCAARKFCSVAVGFELRVHGQKWFENCLREVALLVLLLGQDELVQVVLQVVGNPGPPVSIVDCEEPEVRITVQIGEGGATILVGFLVAWEICLRSISLSTICHLSCWTRQLWALNWRSYENVSD